MKKLIYFFLTAALIGSTGCKKFLEQEPDNRTTVTSVDQIKLLLVSAYPKLSYYAFTESMSDNAEDKGVTEPGLDQDLARTNLQSFLFEDVEATGNDTCKNRARAETGARSVQKKRAGAHSAPARPNQGN